MKKIKVLYMSSWEIAPEGKGSMDYVYDQVLALSDNVDAYFLKVKFISWHKWIWKSFISTVINPVSNLWPRNKVCSYEFFLPRVSSVFSSRTSLEDMERSVSEIYQRLSKRIPELDVIHLHVSMPYGILAHGLSLKYNVPYLIQEHSGPFTLQYNTPEKDFYLKRNAKSCALYVAVGRNLAVDIRSVLGVQLQVIPNLVRTDIFLPVEKKQHSDRIRLVTVTNSQPVKKAERIISLTRCLIEKGVEFSFTAVITSGIEQIFELLAKEEEEVRKRIVLLLRMDKNNLHRVFSESDVYICYSDYETFGLAPAEAISSGLPVVSFKCGGPEEFIDGTNGELVELSDINKMADAIVRVSSKKYDAINMHQGIVSKYSADLYVRRMTELYEQVRVK